MRSVRGKASATSIAGGSASGESRSSARIVQAIMRVPPLQVCRVNTGTRRILTEKLYPGVRISRGRVFYHWNASFPGSDCPDAAGGTDEDLGVGLDDRSRRPGGGGHLPEPVGQGVGRRDADRARGASGLLGPQPPPE